MPTHHLPTESLFATASGAATPGEDLLAACHLTWCPACRAVADELDAVQAALAFRAPPVEVGPDALAAVLARLDERPAPKAVCPVFPRPLAERIGPLAQVPWRTGPADVRVASVPLDGPQRVFLLDFPPGLHLPVHGHEGVERTLVLRGGYTDDDGHFGPGDVSWRERGGHAVRIDPGERCTTLFVNDGSVEVGWFTRVLDWWIG